jgi:D-alanine-D-alanine ligase
MQKIRVGVIRGGPSDEYEISLKTGKNVLQSLNLDKYIPIDILLTKQGEWYIHGVPTDMPTIATLVDVVWNALHGAYGEDGKIQQLFEQFGISYTGSQSLSSALGMHKGLAKERFVEAGLTVPYGEIISSFAHHDDAAFALFRNNRMPLIVKPVSGGSSVATTIVHTHDGLVRAIGHASRLGDVLVETVVSGIEATVCVIDGAESGEHFVLYPIEIVPPTPNVFFDYEAKYGGGSKEICPGRFTLSTHSQLRHLALAAHKSIGARHYSRTDFIVAKDGIYVLEINTLPGLTEESLLPKALAASGVTVPDFLDHIIGLTLSERR